MTEATLTTSEHLEIAVEGLQAIQQRLEAALACIDDHDVKAAITFIKQARNHAEYSQP